MNRDPDLSQSSGGPAFALGLLTALILVLPLWGALCAAVWVIVEVGR